VPMTGPFVLSTDDVAGGGCTTIAKGARSAPTYSAPPRGGAARASPSMTMIDDADGMPTSAGYRHRFGSLIEAYRMASTMVPRGVLHLVIAGTGPREAALRASAPPGA